MLGYCYSGQVLIDDRNTFPGCCKTNSEQYFYDKLLLSRMSWFIGQLKTHKTSRVCVSERSEDVCLCGTESLFRRNEGNDLRASFQIKPLPATRSPGPLATIPMIALEDGNL